MTTKEAGAEESYRVYIVRKKDQKEWRSQAENGNDAAKLCINAAAHFMRAIPNEPCACSCCDKILSTDEKPPAFIVLIPVNEDPETVRAETRAVCADCSTHDDGWIVDQGVKREGLSARPPRAGDKIH